MLKCSHNNGVELTFVHIQVPHSYCLLHRMEHECQTHIKCKSSLKLCFSRCCTPTLYSMCTSVCMSMYIFNMYVNKVDHRPWTNTLIVEMSASMQCLCGFDVKEVDVCVCVCAPFHQVYYLYTYAVNDLPSALSSF